MLYSDSSSLSNLFIKLRFRNKLIPVTEIETINQLVAKYNIKCLHPLFNINGLPKKQTVKTRESKNQKRATVLNEQQLSKIRI